MAESIASIKARLLVNALNPRYPLNVTWLASKILGKPVVIDEQDFPINICALIVNKPEYETVHIGVNRNRTRASQRFSIVHELAHPYLGHKGNISYIEEEEDPVLRTEADAFATEILMPKYRILSLAGKYQKPLPLLRQILLRHDVSLEAACRRLIELEIYRGAFICFNDSQPLFAYNTPGFNIGIEKIFTLPKIEKNSITSKQEIVNETPVTCYLQRFRSGKFLAVWVEENPNSLYQTALYELLEGISKRTVLR